MYSSDELFQGSREGYFGVYFQSGEVTMEINTKITVEWAQEQFVMRLHTSYYFLHDKMNSQNDDLYTWIVISNLFDIDFVHSDIHGRSCKNMGETSQYQSTA